MHEKEWNILVWHFKDWMNGNEGWLVVSSRFLWSWLLLKDRRGNRWRGHCFILYRMGGDTCHKTVKYLIWLRQWLHSGKKNWVFPFFDSFPEPCNRGVIKTCRWVQDRPISCQQGNKIFLLHKKMEEEWLKIILLLVNSIGIGFNPQSSFKLKSSKRTPSISFSSYFIFWKMLLQKLYVNYIKTAEISYTVGDRQRRYWKRPVSSHKKDGKSLIHWTKCIDRSLLKMVCAA